MEILVRLGMERAVPFNFIGLFCMIWVQDHHNMCFIPQAKCKMSIHVLGLKGRREDWYMRSKLRLFCAGEVIPASLGKVEVLKFSLTP